MSKLLLYTRSIGKTRVIVIVFLILATIVKRTDCNTIPILSEKISKAQQNSLRSKYFNYATFVSTPGVNLERQIDSQNLFHFLPRNISVLESEHKIHTLELATEQVAEKSSISISNGNDCPIIQFEDMRTIVGFPQFDLTSQCGDADTLSFLIFTDSPGEILSMELEVKMKSGMKYGGFAETQYGGTTSISHLGGTNSSPKFVLQGIGSEVVMVANIGAVPDCNLDLQETYNIELIYDYIYEDTLGNLLECSGIYSVPNEFNSSLKRPELNMLSPSPLTTTISSLSIPTCQTITVSQDGLQSHLTNLDFAICGLPLDGNLSISSLTANGIDLPYNVNPVDTSTTAHIDESYFTGNISPNPLDNRFNTDEKVIFEVCYSADFCPDEANYSFIYKASYGCDNEICNLTSQAAALQILPSGAQDPIATSIFTGPIEICGNTGTVSLTLENPGTSDFQNTYTDLKIGYESCEQPNLDIIDVRVNGTSLPANAFGWEGDDVFIKFDGLSIDYDGDGIGLDDIDNDGFVDDLEGGKTLSLEIDLGIICGVNEVSSTTATCPTINCNFATFYVRANANCGNQFTRFPTVTPFNLDYGPISVTNPNEVNIGTVTAPIFGYDFGQHGERPAGTNFSGMSNIQFCYDFNSDNIDSCPSGADIAYKLSLSGESRLVNDFELIPNSILYNVNGGPDIAIPDGNATWISDPMNDSKRMLLINGGSTTGQVCYEVGLQLDTAFCSPTQYIAVSQQVVETCSDCNCEIVKACKSTQFASDPEYFDCPCLVGHTISPSRKNYGFEDHAMTIPLTKEDVLASCPADINRYGPGDTMMVEVAYDIKEIDAVKNMNMWKFGAYFYDPNGSGSIANGSGLPVVPDANAGGIISIEINTGSGRYAFSFDELDSCESGDVQSGFPALSQYGTRDLSSSKGVNRSNCGNSGTDYRDGLTNNLYVRNAQQSNECGAITTSTGGNCLQDFFDLHNFGEGDSIIFHYEYPMIRNPLRAAAIAAGWNPPLSNQIGIYFHMSLYNFDQFGNASYCYTYNSGSCNSYPFVDVADFGGVTAFTNLDLDNCGAEVRHTFKVTTPPPIGWYQCEFKPLINIEDVDLTILGPLAYCNSGEVIDYDNNLKSVTVDSVINLACKPVDGFNEKLCGIETGNSGYAVIDLASQGIRPLGVGLNNDDSLNLNYDLCMLCPTDFSLNYSLRYDYSLTTQRSLDVCGYSCNQSTNTDATWCDELGFDQSSNYYDQLQLDSLQYKLDAISADLFINDNRMPDLGMSTSNNGPTLISSQAPNLSVEYQEIEICNADATATQLNVQGSVSLPSSVQLVGAFSDDTGAIQLATTLVSDDGQTKTYSIETSNSSLLPGQCETFYIGTTLLFCPAPTALPPQICVNGVSGCSPANVAAALGGSGTCGGAQICYSYVVGEAGIQTEWFEVNANIDLCSSNEYYIRVKNTKTLTVTDLITSIDLPAGMTVDPNSWELAYPGGNIGLDGNFGSWTSIPAPAQSGNIYSWLEDGDWSSHIDINGLPGVGVSQDSNKVSFRFVATTDCDQFLSGERLTTFTTSTDPCGPGSITTGFVESPSIIINGANPIDHAEILTFANPVDIYCGGLSNTIGFSAINISEVPTADSLVTCLEIPIQALSYSSGSISFSNGFEPAWITETIVGNNLEVCFHSPRIDVGGMFSLSFEAQMSPAAACGDIFIGADVKSVVEAVNCLPGPPNDCAAFVQNSINSGIYMELNPPLNSTNVTVNADCSTGDDPTQVCYEITLENPGPDYNGTVHVGIHDDVTSNGILDAFDTELNGEDHLVSILSGQSTSISMCLDIPAVQSCPLILKQTYDTGCTCDYIETPVGSISPSWFAALDDCIIICPATSLNLQTCGNFEITFEPSAGATMTENGSGELSIQLNDGFGIDAPVKMYYSSLAGDCAIEDFVELKSNDEWIPANGIADVCENDCVELDLMIPSNIADGALVSWSPTIGLDNPNSANPEVCGLTSDQIYNVEINFGNTCVYNITYTVSVNSNGNTILTADDNFYLCLESGVLNAPSGFDTYEWYSTQNGVDILEIVTTSNSWSGPSNAGDYFVRAINSSGAVCPSISNILNVSGSYPEIIAEAIQPTCIDGVPLEDGYLQLTAVDTASHYNYSIGSSYTGSPYISNAISFNSALDLPLQFITGIVNSPNGQEYTLRVFFGESQCYTDVLINMPSQDCSNVPVSVGNFIWLDTNKNGIQDEVNTGLENVTVVIYDNSTGQAVQSDVDGNPYSSSTLTDANGQYLFENLAPGDYYVLFDLSTNTDGNDYQYTITDAVANDETDSDASIINVPGNLAQSSATGFLPGGSQNLSLDAGVIICELNTDLGSDQCVANGDNVVLATNTVFGVEPFSYNWSENGSGNVSSISFNVTSSAIYLVTVTDALGCSAIDQVEINLCNSIGNFVWFDADMDGIIDENEYGLNGITVNLYEVGNPVPIETVVTSNDGLQDGYYSFDGLPPGDYYLELDLPISYSPTVSDFGTNDAIDSDLTGDNGPNTSDVISLEFGDNNPTLDFGLIGNSSLGDYVWLDYDVDGIQDVSENGINDVRVYLLNANGSIIDSTLTGVNPLTSEDGYYSFDNLIPGTYSVQFIKPDIINGNPVLPTLHNEGSDDNQDSDADIITGQTAQVTLAEGENYSGLDAGYYSSVSVGNFVFIDNNYNGIQDASDSPLANVKVTLHDAVTGLPVDYDVYNNPVVSQFTVADGTYLFDNLIPGEYYTVFDLINVPNGDEYKATIENVNGSDEGNDSDINSGFISDTTSFENGIIQDLSLDAGFYLPARIGDLVWEDENGNGIQDPGEPGISNVMVTLTGTDGSGNPIVPIETFTDASGNYEFTDLPPGSYQVTFSQPLGTLPTLSNDPQQNGNDDNDSDADPNNGLTSSVIVLNNGDDIQNIDAGFYIPASIGDLVWLDENGNGIYEPTEVGIPNVEVTLTGTDRSGNPILLTQLTDQNGNYLFEDLAPGEYIVDFTNLLGYESTSLNDPLNYGNDSNDSDADPDNGLMTEVIILESGDNDLTWDAGFYQLGSIGDLAWYDTNGNGSADPGENGISGISVSLSGIDNFGNIINQTVLTDANGNYLFENLPPGQYQIVFDDPNGYIPSTTEVFNVDLGTGEMIDNVDAGYFEFASIGDFVWEDLNANGIQDFGEPGIEGLDVTLTGVDAFGDPINFVTTTDANGNYLFDLLPPGDYEITFQSPAGFTLTAQNILGGIDSNDSDVDENTLTTIITNLESGENDLTWDAGFYLPASLGNYVWEDANNNGLQDVNEDPVENVEVILYDANDNELSRDTTDASGLYLFDNLMPGEYYVEFRMPDGFIITNQNIGNDDAEDSDVDPISNKTSVTALVSGENDLTWDAGIYESASLGDFVWEDTNANGIQDLGEPGIPGVTVYLLDENENIIISAITDQDGFYTFENLTPGTYSVRFEQPFGYIATGLQDPLNLGNDSNDSDADPTNNLSTAPLTLESGENYPDLDAGFYQQASIGNYVWEDLNANGIQEPNEPGIEGVLVTLLDSNGDQLAQKTTLADGSYIFDMLVPGDYSLVFGTPAGMTSSPFDEDSNDLVDSDANPGLSGATIKTSLESGENDLSWDAGFYTAASVGDFVWEDLNANGIQEANEPGIANVELFLTGIDEAGNEVSLYTLTDSEGRYIFENVPPGQNYTVSMIPPLGYELTISGEGTEDNDSNFDPETRVTIIPSIQSGDNIRNVDAGLYQTSGLGNYVWLDANNNGIQDPAEQGIQDVTVNLLDANGLLLETTNTDVNGFYQFTDLIAGDYQVEFISSNSLMPTTTNKPGVNDELDSDIDPITGRSQIISLVSDEYNGSLDAGFFALASVGDIVFEDVNANGVQDPGEPGIPNVRVTLNGEDAEGNTFQLTTQTNFNGNYLFADLPPGAYNIEFEQLPGFVPTAHNDPNNNGDDSNDSDMNPNTLSTVTFQLESGDNDLDWDAGFYEPALIGNLVFEDRNYNGVLDPGEPALPGQTVLLNGTNGLGEEVSLSTTTGQWGSFLFEDLMPGDYSLTFVQPFGYLPTAMDDPSSNGTDNNDSDADPDNGLQTAITNLESGEQDYSWWAGFYEPASLGDFVWLDQNANGIQDFNEVGIEGIEVVLSGNDGLGNMVSLSTQTNIDGKYTFDLLKPGTYTVEFIAPPNYVATSSLVGDSQNDSNGITSTVSLISGENNPSIDAGFYLIEVVISEFDLICLPTNCNESEIQIDVEVIWQNASGDIQVIFDGETRIIDPSTESSPGIVTFSTPADNRTDLLIQSNYVGTAISDSIYIDLLPCDCNSASKLIDGFTVTSDQTILTEIGTNYSSYLTNTVLGGERDVETFLSVADAPLSVYTVGISDPSVFAYAEGGDVRGGFLLSYDGQDGDASTLDHEGLGGIDLTGGAGVVDMFTLGLQSDLAMTLDFDVYTDANNSSRFSLSIDGINVPVGYQLLFAEFIPTAGTGADFADVGAIVMTVNTTNTDGDLDMLLFNYGLACSSCQEAPVAGNDKAFTIVNEDILINVLNNDYDPEGGSLAVALENSSTNGTVDLEGQFFRYTPNTDFIGEDEFTYRLINAEGSVDYATVTINVSSCGNQLTIDLFEIGSPLTLLTSEGAEFSEALGDGILGGERDVETYMTNSDPSFNLFTYGDAQDGQFQYIEAGPVRGGFELVYDGNDGDATSLNPTGLGGIDFTLGGTQNSIEIYLKSDLPADLFVEVYTDGGRMSSGTISMEASSDNILYTLPYSSMVPSIGTGADFTDVGALKIIFDSTPFDGNRDLQIVCITTGCKIFLADNDGDGIFDIDDPDDDNDGIPDWQEAGCLAANLFGTALCLDPALDNDNDGIPNYQDADNCTLNAFGICSSQDTDNDGTPDYFDLDSDNDCIPDYVESNNPQPSGLDIDQDGIDDSYDQDQNGPGLNSSPTDTDGDGEYDYQELDSDNDGLLDFTEANNLPSLGIDSDGDGIDDICDEDNGGPGLNENPIDTDSDGIADYRDPDSDNDGILDLDESNCVLPANPLNICDSIDTDGDGLLDHLDLDSDNDGIPDSYECPNGAICPDFDNDGIPDYRDLDSDGDGITDAIESDCTQPYDENVVCLPDDFDADGFPNHLDIDSDNDGLSDDAECPNYNGITSTCDEDGDGLPDHMDCRSAELLIVGEERICFGSSINLNVNSNADDAIFTWTQAGSTEVLFVGSNPTFTNLTEATSYQVSINSSYCLSETELTHVVEISEPMEISISGSNLLCRSDNNDLSFDVETLGGTGSNFTYMWAGPNNFVSFDAEPFIPNASGQEYSGTYQLQITDEIGCTAVESIQISISDQPEAPFTASNSPICEGGAAALSTEQVIGATYAWYSSNPIENTDAELVSVSPAPNFENLGTGMYTYYLLVTADGCTSELAVSEIQVLANPVITNMQGEGRYCEGASISLSAENATAYDGNVTYTWTGPNQFVYSNTVDNNASLNVPLSNLNELSAGTYSLQLTTDDGCVSAISNVTLDIDAQPTAPELSVNSSDVCEGDQLILTSTPTSGDPVLYDWFVEGGTAPEDFLGTTDVPTYIIDNASSINNGRYYCITSVNNCPSNVSNKVPVTIIEALDTPEATNTTNDNSPACVGEDIELSVPFILDATYLWVGPNGFNSSIHNPIIEGVELEDSGEYYVIVSIDECTPVISNITDVYIQTTTDAPTIVADAPACEFGDVTLSISSTLNFPPGTVVSFEWYFSATNDLVATTSTPQITLANISLSQIGEYYVIISSGSGACASEPSEPVMVEVFGIPENGANAGEDIELCGDNFVELDGIYPSIGTGLWSSVNVGPTFTNPDMASSQVNNLSEGENIFVWSLSNGACEDYSTDTLIVNFTAKPDDVADAGVNLEVCSDGQQTINLGANVTSMSSGLWTQTAEQQAQGIIIENPEFANTPVSGMQAGQEYTFTWSLSTGSCINFSSDMVSVTLNQIPEEKALVYEKLMYTCGETLIELEALTPEVGTGHWTTESGARISNPNLPKSYVENLDPGENIFVWSLSDGVCKNYSTDSVSIFSEEIPLVEDTEIYVSMNDSLMNFDLMDYIDLGNIGSWSIEIIEDATHGTFEGVETGMANYIANEDFFGEDMIRYQVCNENCPDLCAEATMRVVVAGVDQQGRCKISNVISPNRDGMNDAFQISCIEECPDNEVIIFNRWGDKIYNAAPYQNNWSGTYKDRDLPPGTYFYCYTLKKGDKPKTGFFTIVR